MSWTTLEASSKTVPRAVLSRHFASLAGEYASSPNVSCFFSLQNCRERDNNKKVIFIAYHRNPSRRHFALCQSQCAENSVEVHWGNKLGGG
jgi:hypothetical protein